MNPVALAHAEERALERLGALLVRARLECARGRWASAAGALEQARGVAVEFEKLRQGARRRPRNARRPERYCVDCASVIMQGSKAQRCPPCRRRRQRETRAAYDRERAEAARAAASA